MPGRALIFCTAYARTPGEWETRYALWRRAVERIGLRDATVLMVDDGSGILPAGPELSVHTVESLEDASRLHLPPGLHVAHFRDRLGRAEIYDFPGWHRSFAFGCRAAAAGGFERAIHLESDAHLISARAHDFFRGFNDGWAALWSERYQFPEIAAQVAAGAGVAAMGEWSHRTYEALRHHVHESALPFTHVERGLVGDRYGEDLDQIPAEADWATQVQALREPAYYWWLNGGAPNDAPPLIDWTFGRDGNLEAPIGDGWSNPERTHRWMLGLQSVVALPLLPDGAEFMLLLNLMAHVRPNLPRQRLFLFLNETWLGDFEVIAAGFLGVALPGGALRRDGRDKLRFIHPDARIPRQLSDVQDRRWLSLALVRLRIYAAAADTAWDAAPPATPG